MLASCLLGNGRLQRAHSFPVPAFSAALAWILSIDRPGHILHTWPHIESPAGQASSEIFMFFAFRRDSASFVTSICLL